MASQTRDVLLNFEPHLAANASKFDKDLANLVKKGIKAQESQNIDAIKAVEKELMALYGKKGEAELDVSVNLVGNGRGQLKLIEQSSGKLFGKLAKGLAKSEKYSQGFTGELKRGMDKIGNSVESVTEKIRLQTAALEGSKARLQAFSAMKISDTPGAQAGMDQAGKDVAAAGQRLGELQGRLDKLSAKQIKVIQQFAKFAPPAAVQGKLAEINQAITQTEKRVKLSKREMVSFGQAGKSASTAFKSQGMIAGLKALGQEGTKAFAQLVTGASKVNPELANLKKQQFALNAATTKFGKVGMAFKGFGAAVQAAFGPITAIIAGITALMGVINTLTGRQKQLQGLKLTLDGVGVSLANQEAVLARSRNIALSYGVSLTKIEGAFKRLTPAILESGGSLDEASTAIEGISARTTMLGLNAEQSGRYIEAFAQVMGKGKLQSEELNQQFSELDGGLRGQIKNYLAAEEGITDFEGAMKRGEITAGLFLKAFKAINKDIMQKFKKDIDKVQESLNTLGQDGGMTLSQFQAKMQALSSIGLDQVGKALAPLGRELAKIYAAFVQFVTKMATEMPGLQKVFQFLGDVTGRVLKVGINSVLGLVYELARAVDFVATAVIHFFTEASKLPIIGDILRGIGGAINGLNESFDRQIDASARLSDETKGVGVEFNSLEQDIVDVNAKIDDLKTAGKETTPEFKKLTEELASLQAQLDKKGRRELEAKLKMEKDIAESRRDTLKDELKNAQEAEDKQREKVDLIVQGLNMQLDEQEKVIRKNIEGIEAERDAFKKSVAEKIEGIKKAGEEQQRVFRDAKRALKEEETQNAQNYEDKKRALEESFDAEISAVKRTKDEVEKKFDADKKAIDDAKKAVEDRYDAEKAAIDSAKNAIDRKAEKELAQIDATKSAMEEAHEATMANLDAQKSAIESSFKAEMEGLANAKKAAKSAFDRKKADFDSQKDGVENLYKKEVDGIQKAKDRSAAAHSARVRQLDAELSKAKNQTDEVLSRIDAEKAASQRQTDSKIGALEDLTPAERALAEIEEAKLRMQATDRMASKEERLEAQARLERMEREKQISKLQAEEKERQAKLDAQAAEAAEAQAVKEEQILTRKQTIGEEEEARQARLIEAQEAANQRRENSLMHIATMQEEAAARHAAAIATIEAAEELAASKRESGIEGIESKQSSADESHSEAIAALDGEASAVEGNRESAIDRLDGKEQTLDDDRRDRMDSLEDKEEELQGNKEERLNDLDDKEDQLQGNQDRRLNALESKRIQQKRDYKRRLGEINDAEIDFNDDQEDRISNIEDARDQQLDNYKNRIDEQKDKLDDITDKRAEIDTATALNGVSEQNYQIILDATKEKLDANLDVLKDMATETADIASELAAIEGSLGTLDNVKLNLDEAPAPADGMVDDENGNPVPITAIDNDYDPLNWNPDTDSEIGTEGGTFTGDAEVDVDGHENQFTTDRINIQEAEVYVDQDTGLTVTSGANDWEEGFWHGGPISAGKRVTVNELGKEGFMDARTGKMKQINAPSFGKWTAPSSGTVIPAHIWKTLKSSKNRQAQWQESRIAKEVPVDMGSTGGNGASIAPIGSSVMAALAANSGGDSFSNNITIQSNNPTKSAGDMMVAMARMRHRR